MNLFVTIYGQSPSWFDTPVSKQNVIFNPIVVDPDYPWPALMKASVCKIQHERRVMIQFDLCVAIHESVKEQVAQIWPIVIDQSLRRDEVRCWKWRNLASTKYVGLDPKFFACGSWAFDRVCEFTRSLDIETADAQTKRFPLDGHFYNHLITNALQISVCDQP